MKRWIVLGIKWMKIGTRQSPVETGRMIPDPSDNSLSWFPNMVPELEWREVDWNKEMPYVIGVYDYDPSEEFKDRMSLVRIYYYTEEDVTRKEEYNGQDVHI